MSLCMATVYTPSSLVFETCQRNTSKRPQTELKNKTAAITMKTKTAKGDFSSDDSDDSSKVDQKLLVEKKKAKKEKKKAKRKRRRRRNGKGISRRRFQRRRRRLPLPLPKAKRKKNEKRRKRRRRRKSSERGIRSRNSNSNQPNTRKLDPGRQPPLKIHHLNRPLL
jgi:hypothetical protein